MDERAVAQLRAKHDVLYEPTLVEDPVRLQAEAARADAIIVRNRTQGFRVDARAADRFTPFLADEVQRRARVIGAAHITVD